MEVVTLPNGLVVLGAFPEPEVLEVVHSCGPYPLIICDPPYGNITQENWDDVGEDDVRFAQWMVSWTKICQELSLPGAALYVFGGIGRFEQEGRPPFRPFYRYLVEAELQTGYKLSTHVTWAKKRAYGIRWGYLFCREEVGYFVIGNPKQPRLFNIPLLEQRRTYPGYDPRYPAKSEYYRRTNVWMDVVEILRGKVHETQKPDRLYEIMIETHTKEGEYVLDPFAGSGTCARAAAKLNRKFVLVERDPQIFRECVDRLKGG